MKNTFSYEIPLIPIPDEEIQKMIDEEGFSGIVTPKQLREYIRNKIYEVFIEATKSNSSKYTQTFQHEKSSN